MERQRKPPPVASLLWHYISARRSWIELVRLGPVPHSHPNLLVPAHKVNNGKTIFRDMFISFQLHRPFKRWNFLTLIWQVLKKERRLFCVWCLLTTLDHFASFRVFLLKILTVLLNIYWKLWWWWWLRCALFKMPEESPACSESVSEASSPVATVSSPEEEESSEL